MSTWVKGKHVFRSSYQRTKKDRVFTLVNIKTARTISFESWQMAVKLGYVKVKTYKDYKRGKNG